MKQKIKYYMAYTTFPYRLLGVVLIPCAFWILCGAMLWSKHGGLMGAEPSGSGGILMCFMLGAYVVFYEMFTDYWVLGGCLSEAGRGLRYFRTSCSGAEVMRSIVQVDLLRRFLYCMIFSGILFLCTGWKTAIVMGLSMYCVIVGALHGSRHTDGLQRNTTAGFLIQVVMAIVNIINVALVELSGVREEVMLACLAVFYCAVGMLVSKMMVRRVTDRIWNTE